MKAKDAERWPKMAILTKRARARGCRAYTDSIRLHALEPARAREGGGGSGCATTKTALGQPSVKHPLVMLALGVPG